MPRIDPIKLLNCLSVLLLPNGGIKSTDEVQRLAELMTKYSKKLVSKCIYIQILKCTETGLLDLFMGSGGWRLVHMWLTESIVAKNWPLVKELLELLLLCPVDIDRLKTNNCPKLVKELSKDENHSAIRALASKLVEQWLKTVKGEQLTPVSIKDIPKIISDMNIEDKSDEISQNAIEAGTNSNNIKQTINLDEQNNIVEEKSVDASSENKNNAENDKGETNKVETLPVLKITLKDGKQIISQVDDESVAKVDSQDKIEDKDKHKSKGKDKISEKSSNSSSKSILSKHSSKSKSSSDKHHNHKDSSSKHSNSSSKDKRREKDRHSSSHSSKSKSSNNSSSSSSSSSSSKIRSSSKSKEDKTSHRHSSDKDKSREKATTEKEKIIEKEEKPQSPSIHKLGKIPKLSDVKREKPSISIEVRKPDEPKPKTVKTFHSKFRKHGLEEETKPPPSRAAVLTKKPPSILPPTVAITKRPSPIHNESPPEKRPKTIDIDKPGAIKLIPPKAKPMVLQESDMFMDALNASATNKKEPKKRKRRTSGSKDGTANDGSPPHTPTSENKSVPPRFYQDTLDEEENKDKTSEKDMEPNENVDKKPDDDNAEEKMEVSEPHTLTVNGLKGVLCYHKRKGPKKSIRWKPDSELEKIQYFELDETERVNVTKTSFTDMKHLERINERDAFQKARNLTNDDIMEEKTTWRQLTLINTEDQLKVEYGKSSKEKDIQAMRQKGTLQPLYFYKNMIPDSPFEPDLETHTYSEPMIIPLEDVTGNVSDFRNMPWPEPKGNAPPTTTNINVPPIFPPNISQFPNTFPPAQFPVPGFQGPPMIPGDWQNTVPPVMPNGLPGPMGAPIMPPGAIPPGGIPPGSLPPGAMPPRIMGPPDAMMMGSTLFPGPFSGPPDGFNMPPNMFPADFNMPGPQGPPGNDGFSGPGNFRGALRGRGAGGGHWRGKTNGNFDGPPRGRGGARGGRKAVCIHFQRKGSCRQGDSCSFLHPGVNCPY